MSMRTHLHADDLARLQRGALTPVELLAVTSHLEECAACRGLGSAHIDARSLDGVLQDSAEDHPNLETDLFRFVDGTLSPDEHERVEAHLGVCDRCRAEVDDLRAAAASLRTSSRSPARFFLAAAAVIAAVFAGTLWFRPAPPDPVQPAPRVVVTRTSPPPAPPESRLKPEWESLVSEALRTARVTMPAVLAEVRTPAETVRGGGEASKDALSPAQIVVESDRPTFSWPAQTGTASVVIVYSGEDEVAVSPPLRTNRWTPPKPLPRGVPLTWQVELRRDDGNTIIPTPPDPPAMFRIVDAAALQEIEAARQEHPGNDLLIGLLYARAGLQDRAAEALRRHAATRPDSAGLLRSVESW